MPNNHKSAGEVKYSSLISTHRLLRTCGTRTFSRYKVNIVGRTGRDTHTYRFTFTIYERQPLYALGEAVARFFVMNPQGSVSSVSVNTFYRP